MEPKSPPRDALRVSEQDVAAFRLTRHHLATRAPASALAQVAGDIGGAQAQLLSAAQMSLWTRTRAVRVVDVDKALWHDRNLAKVWCMRGSLHLIPSEDFAVFVRGCARREARSVAWLAQAGISVDPINRIVKAISALLERPLTRRELAERLSESLKFKTTKKAGRGWGGSSDAEGFVVGRTVLSVHWLVFLACMRGLACFGPMRGNEATFVRPDRWLPNWHDRPQEEAEEELLRLYLKAHGPATAADFALWTYIRAADARAVWSRLGDELVPVNDGGRIGWVLRDDVSTLQHAEFDRPSVRLLPFFDSFLLGLKDKSHVVDAAHYKRIYRPQGWLSPVLLVDGRAAGVWTHERKGRKLVMRVEPFGAIASGVRSRIKEESEDLRRFLDVPEVAVRFT